MKNYKISILSVIIILIAITIGCKKDKVSNIIPPKGDIVNTPNFASMYFITPNKIGVMFFDLDHDDNKDKKYFIAELIYLTDDTMKIIEDPVPITNLASNWPSDVKNAGMGISIFDQSPTLSRVTVSSSMEIRLNSGIAQYDSTSIFNGNPGTLSPYDDPIYARSMAGKTPQGWTLIQVPSGVGGSTPMYPIFYFKEGYYVDKPYSWATIDAKPISSLVPGGAANKYEWASVDNVITYNNDDDGNFRTHLFFDFKNWRYFTWTEGCAYEVGCTERKLTMSSYKSLDGLLKWPKGWGKK